MTRTLRTPSHFTRALLLICTLLICAITLLCTYSIILPVPHLSSCSTRRTTISESKQATVLATHSIVDRHSRYHRLLPTHILLAPVSVRSINIHSSIMDDVSLFLSSLFCMCIAFLLHPSTCVPSLAASHHPLVCSLINDSISFFSPIFAAVY